MKIKRKSTEFNTVTITLETLDEVRSMRELSTLKREDLITDIDTEWADRIVSFSDKLFDLLESMIQ